MIQAINYLLCATLCATPVINMDTNYAEIMYQCASDGSSYSLQIGAISELHRNIKIDQLELDYEKTTYFSDYETGEDICRAMEKAAKIERLILDRYTAGVVYEYLSERDFSDVVIAGILGNMMAECGGQTLELLWYTYGGYGRYYGLCQWSLYYNPNVNGCDILGQLDYLMSNLQCNMEQFGGSYEYFLSIEDPGEAAKYFCKYYERGSGRNVRAKNARVALEWIQMT